MYVTSSFGLIAGLLLEREVLPDGLLKSEIFTPVVSLLNSIALDMESCEAMDCASGDKAYPVSQASE